MGGCSQGVRPRHLAGVYATHTRRFHRPRKRATRPTHLRLLGSLNASRPRLGSGAMRLTLPRAQLQPSALANLTVSQLWVGTLAVFEVYGFFVVGEVPRRARPSREKLV